MSLFKRILVPLDGSKLAEQAIPLAARLAHATGGSVLLVRVASTPRELGMYATELSPFIQDIMDEELTQATAYLVQVASSKPLAGINTRIAVLSGSIASQILDVTRNEQIDVIVMSSHGYSGFKHWALGSVAQKVMHHSPVPVILLRQHGEKLSGLSPLVSHPVRALVALDGSPFAEATLQQTADLVAALSAPVHGELHLIQLVKMPTVEEEMAYERLDFDVDFRQAALYESGKYLQAVRQRLLDYLGDQRVNVSWSVEECGDVAGTLIKIAEHGDGINSYHPFDIVALATHGHGGLQRWLLGSVTERFLEHSALPMLVVRPTEQAVERLAPHEESFQLVGLD